ncbi:MAG: ABC transporter ATP-binding protein, partial [Victivallaceae bacterium]
VVKRDRFDVEWPWSFSIPITNKAGRIAWQIFAIYVIVFVLAWTLKNIATYINHYFTRWVGAKVITDLRNEIFESLLRQSLRFYGKMDVGHLISRCTNDTAAIESSIANTIADATRCPIEIMACAAAIIVASMQFHNYFLLGLLFVGMPLVVLPVIILGRRVRKIYKSSFAKIAEVVSRMHEVFTGIIVIKAYNTEETEISRFKAVNRKYFRTVVKALRPQLLMAPLMEVVAVTSTLVFLIYSYSQEVTLTQLAALLAPAFMAYTPIKSLAKVVTYIQRSMAAADRYFAMIDTNTQLAEKPDAIELKDFEKEISFNDVTFAYDERKILDGVSFKIKKGSVVAVVGETGSGKTTIANLIARFYDVDDGSVTIDGTDVRDFQVKSLHRHIGIVTQDAILFNDTVANNIAYGCPDATREQIMEAAMQANAHDFIVDGRHREGYDTEVGDKGFKLSGGEKQRVAIARAILKNPPILILDEATSALDTVTERLVQEALNRVMENRTVFAIAHRLSTIKHADMIIVLKQGKIVERGTHQELIAHSGVYRRLHDTQFENS